MNIFEYHLKEIHNLILTKKDILKLDNIENLDKINLEVPPEHFNFDLSCNIAMVLGKSNKITPKKLAEKLKELFLDQIKNFSNIEVAGPGFLNIKLSKAALIENINSILRNNETYGSNKTNETYNIEFVSANPTGPMHVGHCRGAIYGDVLSNLLTFNGNKVTREYYINDYGSQIKNFVESVYHRIIEIKFKSPFPKKDNLYPGLYIKDIAVKILNENDSLNFKDFQKNFEYLKKKSLEVSMELIKKDLKLLGIRHDNFLSETEIINKDLVNKSIEVLKKKNMLKKASYNHLKGKKMIIGKELKD